MRFMDRVAAGRFAVALEITPPQRHLPRVLLRRARLLGDAAQAINVIQRPERQPSLEACLELKAAGLEPVWHLVARGTTREEVAAAAARAEAGGIEQVLCIAGDHQGRADEPSITVRAAIGVVREVMPAAVVGATFNQYARDSEAALRNLLPKLAAGASYIQTQPTFDTAQLERQVAAVYVEAGEVTTIAMAMPLLTAEAGERIAERLRLTLPDRLRDVLATGNERAAWEYFEATLAGLVESGRIAGVAIMTFEMDPPPETGERVVAALERAGAL